MTGYVVYYDENEIYFSDSIENVPLYIPFDIDEKIFSTEKEMMEWIEKFDEKRA